MNYSQKPKGCTDLQLARNYREGPGIGLHFAMNANSHFGDGNRYSAHFDCFASHVDQTGATGDFHVDNGEAPDAGLLEYFGQFRQVSGKVIQLGAGNQETMIGEHLPMKPGTGKGDTVSRQ